jgi:(E)-4-hydroxy-3-methylbut-2-enyl-diphosphate synthase
MQTFPITRRKTYGVEVGHIQVSGGGAMIVQSMTNTDTADVSGHAVKVENESGGCGNA